MYNPALKKQPFTFRVCFSQPRLCEKWDKHLRFRCQGFLKNIWPCRHSASPPCGVSVYTYSRKRRLWILVMAFEAMGLPMPELAGEPWDTGVMLYGEFWLAGERDASLGTLRPLSVVQKGNQTFKKNNKKNPIKCIKINIGRTKWFPLDNKELPSPSWETGSRARSSVNCRPSSPCSSWPEDSCSTFVLPFFPSRSFKIIYGNKIYMEWQKQKHLKTFASSKISIPLKNTQFRWRLNNIPLPRLSD